MYNNESKYKISLTEKLVKETYLLFFNANVIEKAGSDLSYLFGAILTNGTVIFRRTDFIIQFLQEEVGEYSDVFKFITIEE